MMPPAWRLNRPRLAGYQDFQGFKALGGISVLDRRTAVSPPD
jgi:hypothetical protein